MKSFAKFTLVLLATFSLTAFAYNPGTDINQQSGRGTIRQSIIKDLLKTDCNQNLAAQKHSFKKGDLVYVEWAKHWYKANILRIDRRRKKTPFLINYDGWSHSWDEWVGFNRIIHRSCD